MARTASLLASVPLAMSHGFIDFPMSRQMQVCQEVYADEGPWDTAGPFSHVYYCLTARETICWGGGAAPFGCGQGVVPGEEQSGHGYPAGTLPGKSIIAEPFCSAGPASNQINQEVVDKLAKRRDPQAFWVAGDTVEVGWNVNAAHGGRYAYFLCCDGSDTWDCFSKTPLKDEGGDTWFDVDWVGGTVDVKKNTLKLPKGVTGECTLAWRWDGGCDNDKLNCPASQPSESSLFASCSDVTIDATPSPHPPIPSPKPSPTPTPAPSPSTAGKYCCWSAWGDDSQCGKYPSSSKGLCSGGDWSQDCMSDAACATVLV